MKSSILCIIAAGFLAGAVLANPGRETLTVTTTATAAVTVAATNTIRGYVEEVVFDVPAGSQTGDVSLVTLPNVTTEAARTIASTNSITADTTMRPRWKADNSDGTAQGTEYACRFLLVGESIVFAVTNATVTGAVWRCHVKYDDGK